MGIHKFQKNGLKAKRALIFFVIIAATTMMAGLIYIGSIQKRLQNIPSNEEIPVKPIGSKPFNMLVIGKDSDSFTKPGRADTIMVVRVFPKKQKAYLLSIPRDTRVKIKGHGRGKINASYAFGDVKLTIKTIEDLMDIDIARYVVVNWSGFEKMVDLLGGVRIDVEKPMNYEARSTKAYIHLKPGRQLLNGKQALGYVRFRHDARGDLGRIPRQQKFVYSLIEQAKQIKNILRLPSLIDQLVDNTRTNAAVGELFWLGKLFWGIEKKDLTTATLPGEGKTINKASYFVIDEAEIGPIEAKLGANYLTSAKAGDISVNVYNASGIVGAAKTQAKILEDQGFKVLSVKPFARTYKKTVVSCRKEDIFMAKALLFRIPSAKIKISNKSFGKSDVAVFVGKDLAQTLSKSQQNTLN